MARSVDEILSRIKFVERSDLFGVQRVDLVHALRYDDAKPFLADGVAADAWEQVDPMKAALDYMPFAIDKATDHRGLSASRSVDHFRSWLWLLGPGSYGRVDWDTAWGNYGVAVLKQVARVIGYEWPEDEALNRMAAGLPCRPGCDEGCE